MKGSRFIYIFKKASRRKKKKQIEKWNEIKSKVKGKSSISKLLLCNVRQMLKRFKISLDPA
jgi:hypothetical protein